MVSLSSWNGIYPRVVYIRLMVLFTALSRAQQTNVSQKNIPIGAIFDHESVEELTGFNYAIIRHRQQRGENTFKLRPTVDRIDMENSYQLTNSICNEMENGIFALFGVKNIESLGVIQSLARRFHMPYISPSLSRPAALHGSPYEIHMLPSYTQLLVDLMWQYGWQKIHFLYDTDAGLMTLQELYQLNKYLQLDLSVHPRKIANPFSCHEELRNLDREDHYPEKVIFVEFSTTKQYQSFLRQVSEVGMNKYGYHYVIGGFKTCCQRPSVSAEEVTEMATKATLKQVLHPVEAFVDLKLGNFRYGGVNITGFQLLDYASPKLQEFLDEWEKLDPGSWKGAGQRRINYTTALTLDSVEVFVRAIKKMTKRNGEVFKFTFRRGRLYNNGTIGVPCMKNPTPWMHGKDIIEEMHKVDFIGLTGRIAFDQYGFRKNYTIAIHATGLHFGPEKIGEWRQGIGFTMVRYNTTPILLPDASREKVNETIRITGILNEPYLMRVKVTGESGIPPIGNKLYDGYCVELAEKILDKWDYVFTPVKDGKYGEEVTNGKWSGMVGELLRGEADIAIADLTITRKREEVIDFSIPFMGTGISIMIKKPAKQKPGVFSFMAPLHSTVWMCVVVAFLVVSIVLFFVSRVSPYEWKQEMTDNGPTVINEFDLSNSFWFSFGALMQQGGDLFPRSLAGRVIGSVWWFFTLMIISSYTANLAAFLTIERMVTQIDSADDLAAQSIIHYGTVDSGSTKEFFKQATVPTFSNMWRFMSTSQPSVFVRSVPEGLSRVRIQKGKYAFLLESTSNDYLNNRQPCDTMKVGTDLDSKHFGIATPTGSIYSEYISDKILVLSEKGELQRLKEKWWYDRGECGPPDENTATKKDTVTQSLFISNLAGIFYILVGGLGLSMVVGLFELLLKSRQKRNTQQPGTSVAVDQTRVYHDGACSSDRENIAYSTEYSSIDRNAASYQYGGPKLIGFEPLCAEMNAHTQV